MINGVRPLAIIFNVREKEKFAHLKDKYKLEFSNPEYFKIASMRHDYFWADEERIIRAHKELGIPKVNLEEYVEPANKEDLFENAEVPVEEEEEPKEAIEDMSWPKLRAAAKAAGLEGTFGKAEAIEFLHSQE